MKNRSLIFLFTFFALLGQSLGLGLAFAEGGAARPVSTSSVPSVFLPRQFAGWRVADSIVSRLDPAVADQANADVLNEYGFVELETAAYVRSDSRKLTIKAVRFQDASGAYGAFTFYRTLQMQNEKIGDEGSSLGVRVLFCRGGVLVDAVFDKLSAMSAAELRELADDLPKASGSEAKLPDLPAYLPKQSYVSNSERYVIGPLGLNKSGAPLPAQYVDFGKGAEVVLGDYSVSNDTGSSGSGKLMLIGYPTPQIAAGQLAQIDSARNTHQLLETPLALRRTGRIVALVSGNIPEDAAKVLISAVNYDADVTWNENTYHNPRDNVGSLVLGVMLLAAIVCGLSLVSGLAFGGFRLAVKRLLPGKVFDRPEQIEIIALNLSDPAPQSRDSGVSSSIQAG